jgi:uncharacterized protein YycO
VTGMPEPQPGDYGVVSTRGFYSWLIRVGTRSQFTHAFIVMPGSRLIEAEPSGAREMPLSEYDGYDVRYNTGEQITDAQRAQICAKAETLLGTPYGWTDIARLALRCLGVQWAWLTRRADNERAMICSQIVAACGDAAGLDWNCGREAPAAVTPGDLANRIKGA